MCLSCGTCSRCLRRHFREEQCGIPWFLLPTPGGEHVADAVAAVRERLRPQRKESRHQIIAGLSFSFWSGLLGPKYEELWRDCLHQAFPNSSGKRKQVAVAVERVRKFRNRLAHHDSTINVDVPFELRQILELPAVLHRRDNVEWTSEEAARLRASEDRFDRKIAAVIDASIAAWVDGRYQVFLLTGPGHPDHRQLGAALPHHGTGRGSAFVQRQRYVSLHSLETATTTADL